MKKKAQSKKYTGTKHSDSAKGQSPSGAMGFGEDYWQANYSKPKEMDTIGNAREHVRYLQALFKLEQIDINSFIDFGHGPGYLFQALLKAFMPYEAVGLEPSPWAFKESQKRIQATSPNMRLRLEKTDIISWCQKNALLKKSYDLGICTSVLQYLTDDELKVALPIMASHVKYLYLTVPTENEYKRLWDELQFKDDYCIQRSAQDYHNFLAKEFTFVSNRLLESKSFFNEHNTNFRELLFRF